MGRPVVRSLNPAAAQSTGYALSQGPLGGALALALNGALVNAAGVGVPDVARRVYITSAGDDSGITWTIVGTNRNEMGNSALTETIAGGNGAGSPAISTQDFATVTSITSSGATAGTVTAGTGATVADCWVVWDQNQTDFAVSVMGNVISGPPTWTCEYTYDDPFGLWLPVGVSFPRPLAHAILKNLAISLDGSFGPAPIRASRLTLTALGSLQMTQPQAGAGR